jgi:alpha-beta hydrolase superfamily lysophospholipase
MPSPDVIPCFSWKSKGLAKAVLLCIHGLGLHAGTYRLFGEQMARRGVATYAPDVRGFGRWRDTDSCILNFPMCLEDIKAKIEELRTMHPGLPVFLLGESLGGAISTRYTAQYGETIDGLILCAPARELSDHPIELLITLFKFLARPGQKVCLADSVFRNSPNVQELKQIDPHVRTEFTPGELIHLCGFLRGSTRRLAQLPDIPVLFIQGMGDALIKPRTTLNFFERIPTTDKDLVIIGDAQHLIFQNMIVPRKALTLVENWIDDHLPQTKPLRRAA